MIGTKGWQPAKLFQRKISTIYKKILKNRETCAEILNFRKFRWRVCFVFSLIAGLGRKGAACLSTTFEKMVFRRFNLVEAKTISKFLKVDQRPNKYRRFEHAPPTKFQHNAASPWDTQSESRIPALRVTAINRALPTRPNRLYYCRYEFNVVCDESPSHNASLLFSSSSRTHKIKSRCARTQPVMRYTLY